MAKKRVINCLLPDEDYYNHTYHDYQEVIGIDPSWLTGLIAIKYDKTKLPGSSPVIIGPNTIIDIKREMGKAAYGLTTTNEKIKYIVDGVSKFVLNLVLNNPDNKAIFAGDSSLQQYSMSTSASSYEVSVEVPILGTNFRNKSTIDQGRLFQAIIDRFEYTNHNIKVTETGVSTAKSSIRKGAHQLKKWQVHEIIENEHEINYNTKEYPSPPFPLVKHREAVLDAFTVALAITKRKNL